MDRRGLQHLADCGDVQHEIVLKLLFYTAVRVSERVRIRVYDVELEPEEPCLALEYVEGPALYDMIKCIEESPGATITVVAPQLRG